MGFRLNPVDIRYGSGVRVSVEFTLHTWFLRQKGLSYPFLSPPLEVQLSATVGEGAIAVFDNLELCERSNQCDAIYPSCTVATLDCSLLIDYSRPMVGLRDGYDAHLESRQQAARTVTISI